MNELQVQVRPPSVHQVFFHEEVLMVVIVPDEDSIVEVEDFAVELNVT